MRKSNLLEIVHSLDDHDEIVAFIFTKDEADEHIENNESESISPLTQEEWSQIVTKMSNDEGDWQELDGSFRYYIERAIQNRKKVADGNSGLSN
jgi:hypothetical protein